MLTRGEIEWQAAVQRLTDQLRFDTAKPVPKGLPAWSKAFINYIQIFRKLDSAYGYCVQPQKRLAAKDVVQACLHRILELYAYLVELNGGKESVSLDPLLPELRLLPDALEIPVPQCFLTDALAVAAQRRNYLHQLAGDEQGQHDASTSNDSNDSSSASELDTDALPSPVSPSTPARSPSPHGRAWSRARRGRSRKRPRPPDQDDKVVTPRQAATRIQAAVRGWHTRRKLVPEEEAELRFLAMAPQDAARGRALRRRDMEDRHKRRALTQQRQQEFVKSYATLRQEVAEREGASMRLDFKQKIVKWCHENRDPATGALPDLPAEEAGGSRIILEAPRALAPPVATKGAKGAAATGKGAAATGKGAAATAKGSTAKAAPAKPAAAPPGKGGKKGPVLIPAAPTDFVADVDASISALDKLAAAFAPANVLAALAAPTQPAEDALSTGPISSKPLVLDPLSPEISATTAPETLPQASAGAEADPLDMLLEAMDQRAEQAAHRPNAGLIRDQIRPLVTEAMRLESDTDMRRMVQELKDEAKERLPKAKAGKKGKKGGAKKGKGGGKKGAKEGGGGKKGGGKKGKDPTGSSSLEAILADLVSAEVVRASPPAPLTHYLGEAHLVPPPPPKPTDPPSQPSPADVRRAVTATCILPLIATPAARARLNPKQAVLLLGCKGTGKTMLSQAVAHHTGAMWFDISPRNTDGKFSGKAAATMIHNVFKMAKALAPSVIYIDEVEKVFVADKKKQKQFGGSESFNRIKKDLLKQMKKLSPEDRVLLLGNTSQPQLCARKDEGALKKMFATRLTIPVPDYASRLAVWKGLLKRHIGGLPQDLDLSTLTRLSAGYAPGSIDQVLSAILTRQRRALVGRRPLTTAEVAHHLGEVPPVPMAEPGELLAWAVRPPPEPPAPKDGKDGKGKAKK